ncbi:Phosphoserine transaminase [Tilletia horrida]|uniref:phosphoserine transaminase n=1 Tax=Tilletia horrida TaxID=155126 RepID=A0AAN6GRS0_9BASI|nr:Phosphoserine transaminase [Tilletia horrida]KAK0553325.1 Phosphoserine transaminase [Tilletia horrida]KAK0567710.1 Phosphoserine transaminase [Tilletia horrida]
MANFNISKRDGTINLGAGPSMLPTDVLLEAAHAILDYEDSGMGVIEISHRSSSFKKIVDKAEADLRALLDIPDSYAILFQQGGGTEQFSATALNLLAAHAVKNPDYFATQQGRGQGQGQGPPADYAITGSWSTKAHKEAQRLGIRAHAVVDARKVEGSGGKFGSIPPISTWDLSPVEQKPAFLYYCDNETVDGVEFPSPGFPIHDLPEEYRKNVPLVADCSSNILSRPIDIAAHAIVFFGAQKNVGPSGVTVCIVRRDLIVNPDEGVAHGGPRIPTTLVYKNAADNASLYNTPPMFSIYTSGLVFADLLHNKGGLPGAAERAGAKSKAVYGAIDASGGVFKPTVRQPEVRSRMNVTFRIVGADGSTPDDELEAAFVKACAERGIQQVKGHRSVGGIRTSLYNAVTVEQTQVLVDVMNAFAKAELERRKA